MEADIAAARHAAAVRDAVRRNADHVRQGGADAVGIRGHFAVARQADKRIGPRIGIHIRLGDVHTARKDTGLRVAFEIVLGVHILHSRGDNRGFGRGFALIGHGDAVELDGRAARRARSGGMAHRGKGAERISPAERNIGVEAFGEAFAVDADHADRGENTPCFGIRAQPHEFVVDRDRAGELGVLGDAFALRPAGQSIYDLDGLCCAVRCPVGERNVFRRDIDVMRRFRTLIVGDELTVRPLCIRSAVGIRQYGRKGRKIGGIE